MFISSRGTTAFLLAAAGLLAGCAGDGGPAIGTTASISEPAKVDPACVSLAAQIDQLSKEGTPDRLAQASSGKTATVPVKRESLAKQAQLNKANADFRTKCSTITPKPQQQAAAAAPSGAGVAPAAAVVASAPPAEERVRVRAAEPRSALEDALASDNRGQ